MDIGSKTDLQAATRHMIASADKRAADVSREMGKSSGYLSVVLADKRTPRLDLLAKIANACGYAVLLVGHGEALEVTPEPCNDSPCTVTSRYAATPTPSGGMILEVSADSVDVEGSAHSVDDATRRELMDAGRVELIGELAEWLGMARPDAGNGTNSEHS